MELRWVTAAPSGSCADTKGPLRRPPGSRSPEKTDADGSLLTCAVRTATWAGRPSPPQACECPPPSRKTAHCCGCAPASGHHPHLRGIGYFVITAHGAIAGAFAAIDAAGSLLTRSVNAAPANGHAMAARGRMISIGRDALTARLARVAALQALSAPGPRRDVLVNAPGPERAASRRRDEVPQVRPGRQPCGHGSQWEGEREGDPAQGPPLEALARCRFDSALDQQVVRRGRARR